MEKEKLEQYLFTLKGSEATKPFGPEAQVYKVMGKMFALVSQESPVRVTLKCDPQDAEQLVEQFKAISPGYHMNKRHWITIQLTGEVADEMLTELANDSYKLVVAKLSKTDKQRLSEMP